RPCLFSDFRRRLSARFPVGIIGQRTVVGESLLERRGGSGRRHLGGQHLTGASPRRRLPVPAEPAEGYGGLDESIQSKYHEGIYRHSRRESALSPADSMKLFKLQGGVGLVGPNDCK